MVKVWGRPERGDVIIKLLQWEWVSRRFNGLKCIKTVFSLCVLRAEGSRSRREKDSPVNGAGINVSKRSYILKLIIFTCIFGPPCVLHTFQGIGYISRAICPDSPIFFFVYPRVLLFNWHFGTRIIWCRTKATRRIERLCCHVSICTCTSRLCPPGFFFLCVGDSWMAGSFLPELAFSPLSDWRLNKGESGVKRSWR